MAATFSVYHSRTGPSYPDTLSGATRDRAEQCAIEGSAADPDGRTWVIERDDTWAIAAEYRHGRLRTERPHDQRATRTAETREDRAMIGAGPDHDHEPWENRAWEHQPLGDREGNGYTPAVEEGYDPLRDLAHLLVTVLNWRTDGHEYADRIASHLGLGEDDSPRVVHEVLAKALGVATAAREAGEGS